MNEHLNYMDWVPLYVAGTLDAEQCQELERHLQTCSECRAELAFWKSVSGTLIAENQDIAAPSDLVDRALAQVHTPQRHPVAFHYLLQLLKAQVPLVRRDIWPTSIGVMVLGYILAVIACDIAVIHFMAPLVAAACVALVYGPENDPAVELLLSTPTSPQQVLLSRLVLVFGFNLLLMLVATLGLLPFLSTGVLGDLILGWLGPMTFLSAVALLGSLWIGSMNAITLSYCVWLGRYLGQGSVNHPLSRLLLYPVVSQSFYYYQQFWNSPVLLLSLAFVLVLVALYSVKIPGRSLPRWA
ncbi:MAG: zf-HC2 domain-containing protein [Anaerolineae bacterium]|nr:zf-HC2 domain-containing protein [Anaerolineae bacterium]